MTTAIDKYFFEARHYVRMVARGYADSLILISEPGAGKSFQVLEVLRGEGLEEGAQFVYITTFATPLELYHILYQNQDKIVILDDMSGILRDEKAISILKAALWSVTPARTVHYYSTTDKLDAPSSFVFTGRVIFCVNTVNKNDFVLAPLVSRCLSYEIKLTFRQKLEIMKEIAETDAYSALTRADRMEVFNFLAENVSEATIDFSIRTLIKSFNIRAYSGPGNDWRSLVLALLDPDEDILAYKQSVEYSPIVKEQVRRFSELSGRSRRTFYRIHSKLRRGTRGALASPARAIVPSVSALLPKED